MKVLPIIEYLISKASLFCNFKLNRESNIVLHLCLSCTRECCLKVNQENVRNFKFMLFLYFIFIFYVYKEIL